MFLQEQQTVKTVKQEIAKQKAAFNQMLNQKLNSNIILLQYSTRDLVRHSTKLKLLKV